MNDSSLNQALKQRISSVCNAKLKKKQAPISLIDSTQTIFLKNKPGEIAKSYIDGSQAIQNAEKAKRLLMNNILFNQPKNTTNATITTTTHLKYQSNIIKTIQTTILGSNRYNAPKTSHSIVNSFTSNPVKLNQSKAMSKNREQSIQSIKERYETETNTIQSVNMNKTNITQDIKKDVSANKVHQLGNKVSNSFVSNGCKGGVYKSKVSQRKSKQPSKTKSHIETIEVSLKDTNDKIQNTSVNTTEISNNNYYNHAHCITEETQMPLEKRKEKEISKNKVIAIKKPLEDISSLMKKTVKTKNIIKYNTKKALDMNFLNKKGKNVSINLAFNNNNSNTNTNQNDINKAKVNEEEQTTKETDAKDKDKDKPKEDVSTKPKYQEKELKHNNVIKKNKAPKCPMKLNLLSLIQENNKYKSYKDTNSSKCSYENISSIIQTDPNQLDSTRFMEFDSFDDMNSIIRKLNFNPVNKNAINIFSDTNPTYQQFQDKFNERFNCKILRYDNSERRTNVSGSTCENSSKKQFLSLSKREYQMIKGSKEEDMMALNKDQ